MMMMMMMMMVMPIMMKKAANTGTENQPATLLNCDQDHEHGGDHHDGGDYDGDSDDNHEEGKKKLFSLKKAT